MTIVNQARIIQGKDIPLQENQVSLEKCFLWVFFKFKDTFKYIKFTSEDNSDEQINLAGSVHFG